ncbi:carboxypeptidase-like regulatory domain-containing protein, partial [Alkalihalophilus lindianensis]
NNSTNESVTAASVLVKGTTDGTYTSDKGTFSLKVKSLPVTLIISSVGFASKEVEVTTADAGDINLTVSEQLGQDVVVSATRVAQRILE